MALAPEQAGIGIRRHFTTRRASTPTTRSTWERRDARITNFRDGSVAFEQLGVEFPAAWSLNATNIVAQKYFRGTLGTPERRVVAASRSSTGWSTPSPRGASRAATSSTTTRPRPSAPSSSTCSSPRRRRSTRRSGSTSASRACPSRRQRLLHPLRRRHDGLDPQLVRRGGHDLQGRLGRRASTCPASARRHEHLKGGGTASGPVSFMRGADASAGTIKSGGKTRRAAKMVILDVDHPDIEEFIWCKALEERKARVLRDAGFDMDLDGARQPLDPVPERQQLGAGHRRVHAGRRRRRRLAPRGPSPTGEVVKTVRARDLMRQISQAAWECADPGMQFDTTINRWHTAANTGRINGSNPCSEYMHLDNSACNLASLNLLKFLDDDDTLRRRGLQARRRGRVHRPGDPRRQRRLPDRADRRERPRASASSASATPTSAPCSWRSACPTTPTRAGPGPPPSPR